MLTSRQDIKRDRNSDISREYVSFAALVVFVGSVDVDYVVNVWSDESREVSSKVDQTGAPKDSAPARTISFIVSS